MTPTAQVRKIKYGDDDPFVSQSAYTLTTVPFQQVVHETVLSAFSSRVQ